jgi:hypothetical protein
LFWLHHSWLILWHHNWDPGCSILCPGHCAEFKMASGKCAFLDLAACTEGGIFVDPNVVHTSSLRRSWRIYAGIILYTSSFSHCMQFMTF